MQIIGTVTNTQCPDFASHHENAYDRWIDDMGRSPDGPGEWEIIDEMAEAEYLVCDGH